MQLTLEITSPEVLEYIRREEKGGTDAAAAATKALEIGVSVIERVGLRNDSDYLRLEVLKIQSGMEKFTEMLPEKIAGYVRERFDPEAEGSYTAHFSSQLEKLSGLLDPEKKDSLQEHIRRCLDGTKEEISDMLDAGRSGSFAWLLHEFVRAEFGEGSLGEQKMQELRDDMEGFVGKHFEELRESLVKIEAVKAVKDKMYDKGSRYEEEVHVQLLELASMRQESVESTGGHSAAGCRDKKGDFAYTLKTGGTITVEAKSQPLSVPKAEEYLKSAVATRGSFFGIMVFREDCLPSGVPHLRISDNRIITTDRYLPTALHIAQAFDRASTRGTGTDHYGRVCEMAAAVFKEVDGSRTRIRNLRKHISNNIGTIESGMDSAVEGLNKMLELLEAEAGAA